MNTNHDGSGVDLDGLEPTGITARRRTSGGGSPKPDVVIETPSGPSLSSPRSNDRPATLYSRVPDPAEDFHMFERMSTAFTGIDQVLEEYRRNWGRLGFASQNAASDLSDAWLSSVAQRDSYGEASAQQDYEELRQRLVASGLHSDVLPYIPEGYEGAFPQGNETDFERTVHQEFTENLVVGCSWPVITGECDEVPVLPTWKDVGGNLQAYLYGYADAVGELSKILLRHVFRTRPGRVAQLDLYERYAHMAESMVLVLRTKRHAPGYVINNMFFDKFSKKVRWLERNNLRAIETVVQLRNLVAG